MNLIVVGDMHVKRDNIEESKGLIEWIVSEAKKHKATVLFTGDQYNEMGVARVEVMEFWNNAYRGMLTDGIPTISLIGNHDLNADGTASSMSVHNGHTQVIDAVGLQQQSLGYLGFIRNNEQFVQRATELYNSGVRTLFCHAEINGAQYENGFYAPHGIDLSLLPKDLRIVSGHIHLQQQFANVWYVGTPRQLTRSDIGSIKGIWLMKTDDPAQHIFIPTPFEVQVPFHIVSFVEGQEAPALPNCPANRIYAEVHGSQEFIKKVCSKLPTESKIRTFPTSAAVALDIKESDGIPLAFAKYANIFFTKEGVPSDVQSLAMAEIYKSCPSLKVGVSVQ